MGWRDGAGVGGCWLVLVLVLLLPLLTRALCGQWNDLGYKNSMIRSPSLDKLATDFNKRTALRHIYLGQLPPYSRD